MRVREGNSETEVISQAMVPMNLASQIGLNISRIRLSKTADYRATDMPLDLITNGELGPTKYYFFLRAHTGHGVFDSNLITVETASAELSIRNMSAAASARQLYFSWLPPAVTNLRGYEVKLYACSIGDIDCTNDEQTEIYTTTFAFDRQSFTFTCADDTTCVRPYTKYRVLITALSISGPRGVSTMQTIVSLGDTPEGQTALSDITPLSTAVRVRLTPPSFPNGVLVEYGVRIVNLDTLSEELRTFPIELGEVIELDSLSSATSFNISAKAANSFGYGNFGPATVVRTLQGPPGQLDRPVATFESNVLVVTWDTLLNYDAEVIYELQMLVVDDATPETVYSGSNTSVALPQPTRDKNGVRVRARSVFGAGPWSAETLLTTASASSTTIEMSYIVIAILLVVFAIILAAVFALRHYRRRHLTSEPNPDKELSMIEDSFSEDVKQVLLKLGKGAYKTAKILPESSVTLLDKLGEGKFGFVHKAWLDEGTGSPPYLVAVKSLKSTASDSDRKDMLLEAAVMSQVCNDGCELCFADFLGSSHTPISSTLLLKCDPDQ